MLPVLLTLFLMSFLDTLGTLVGVGAAAGMLDRDGNMPQIERPMAVDAVDFEDLTELVPAFATIVMMAFTYNIANGLTAGLVLHPLMKLLAGRGREITGGGVTLALLCLVYYAFGLPH